VVGCVLVAAGSGVRLGLGTPKALAVVSGRTLLEHAVDCLARVERPGGDPVVSVLVVVVPAHELDRCRELVLASWAAHRPQDPPPLLVVGGADRQASVAAGLQRLPPVDTVLVHDAARALAPGTLVSAVADAVTGGAVAVVPGLPVADTVKQLSTRSPSTGSGPAGGDVRTVERTLDRASLVTVQTPQGFRADLLRAVHAALVGRDPDAPTGAGDDAGMLEAAGHPVVVVPGHPEAFKVTDPLDLVLAAAVLTRRAQRG